MTFEYQHVKVIRVVDGDTICLDIDMGNSIWWTANFRLSGIDTPERGQPGYGAATFRVQELVEKGLSRVITHKPDKFGRWLADVYVPVDGGDMLVNQVLINEGLAKPYFGGVKV